MAFAVMRIKKLKSMQQVRGAIRHNARTIDTPNADKNIKNESLDMVETGKNLEYYHERLGSHKPRKNAVMGIEILCSASPEYFENNNPQYLASRTKNWIEQNFGNDNVVKMDLHLDEKTPHIHAVIIPMKDGKLNSTHFIGGHKSRLEQLQDSYHNAVKDLGLERGLKGSKIEHQDVKKFYSKVKLEIAEHEKVEKILMEKITEKRSFGRDKTDINKAIDYVLKATTLISNLKKEIQKQKEDNQRLTSQQKSQDNQIQELQGDIRYLRKTKRAIERKLKSKGVQDVNEWISEAIQSLVLEESIEKKPPAKHYTHEEENEQEQEQEKDLGMGM